MLNDYNLTMLTDFYEITMANGYFNSEIRDQEACFDLFFRKVPDGGGFAIMAGLEQIIAYLRRLSFTDEDIEYLRSKNCFSEGFLDYLKDFKFSCDVWAVPEGYPIFPYEPLIIVKGPAIQAQFIETFMLMQVNHQSLIATKSNRIVRSAHLPDMAPISGLFTRSRSPPQPNTHINLPLSGVISLAAFNTFSSPSGV